MYNIYFDKRILKVCDIDTLPSKDPNAIIFNAGSSSNIGVIPELVEQCPKLHNVIVPAKSDKIETTFRQICSQYSQINAGGGLVENENGEFLLIFRNGMWDLPKGKQEPGEDIRTTALREVEEECGISDLQLKEHICTTRHCYRMRGNFMLKHTYWYRMHYTGTHTPKPQTEENIMEAKWVKREFLPEYISNTYPSIKEVFEKAAIVSNL